MAPATCIHDENIGFNSKLRCIVCLQCDTRLVWVNSKQLVDTLVAWSRMIPFHFKEVKIK